MQNPEKMGYLSVKTMFQILQGAKAPLRVDTGVAVVSRENINDPDIRALLP